MFQAARLGNQAARDKGKGEIESMPAGGFDREAQLMLGCMQVLLGLGAVSCHVIVVGFAGVFHLVDRFNNVVVNAVQIVPVVHLC